MKNSLRIGGVAVVFVGRGILSAFLMTAALLGDGCTPRGEARPDTALNGEFRLVAVDGHSVPTALRHGNVTLQVRAGTFTFVEDGSCVSRIWFTPPTGHETCRETRATFTRVRDRVTMKWEGAGQTTGTLAGDRFTMRNEANRLEFQRER